MCTAYARSEQVKGVLTYLDCFSIGWKSHFPWRIKLLFDYSRLVDGLLWGGGVGGLVLEEQGCSSYWHIFVFILVVYRMYCHKPCHQGTFIYFGPLEIAC